MARLRWRAVGIAVLFVLVSSVERVGSDEIIQLEPADDMSAFLGEKEGLWTSSAKGAAPKAKKPKESAAQLQLRRALEKGDPLDKVSPVNLKSKAVKIEHSQSALAKQLRAFKDVNGKSVVASAIPKSSAGSTYQSGTGGNVAIPTAPGDPKNVNAMVAGKNKGAAVNTDSPAKFRSIPFFKFSHLGVTKGGLTEKQCQNKCGEDANCLSFSFNAAEGLCVMSKSAMQYDLEFDFFAKKGKKTEGDATFRHLGAMKYAYHGKNTQATAERGFSKESCKTKCAKDDKCKSFTYRQRDKLCLRSAQRLGYAQGWTYFEKQGAAAKVAEEAKYGKPVKGSTKALMKTFTSAKLKRTGNVSGKKSAPVRAAAKTLTMADHAALSPTQLAYLAKKTKEDNSHITQQEIIKNALQIREHKLDEEQAARVAIAKMAAEKAKKVAAYTRTKESKGKEMFATELRSSNGQMKGVVEKAKKSGWNAREKKRKDIIRAREQSHKRTIEMAAKKVREKTRKKTQEKAQKELELTDAVKAAAAQVRLAKEDLTSAKLADKNSAKRIKLLVAQQQRAVKTLAQAADMAEENNARNAVAKATKTIARAKKLQHEQLSIKKKVARQIPGLMQKVQAEEATLKKIYADPNAKKWRENEKAAKGAIQKSDSGSKLAMTEAAHAQIKANAARAKAAIAHAKSTLKRMRAQEDKAVGLISSSKDKEDAASTLKNKMEMKAKELSTWRQHTKDTMTVLLGSSKFQEKQEIANEARIKGTLGAKMKQIIVVSEKHKKHVVKLKEYRLRVRQLEKAEREQADERKVKRGEASKEKSTKTETKTADKAKQAKTKEKQGAKLLNAAKLAQATAVTVAQKVKAAQSKSRAESLKVSGEQKLAAVAPDEKKAQAAEQAATNKLDSEKDLMSSDETKLQKAEVKTAAAKAKLKKVVAKGPVVIAKKEKVVTSELAEKSARLSGANPKVTVDGAEKKQKALHKKAQASLARVHELHAKLKAKQELALKGKARKFAERKEKNDPALLRKKIVHMKAHESSVKTQIRHIRSGKHEAAQKVEDRRREASKTERSRKRDRKEKSRKKFAARRTAERLKVKLAREKERTVKAAKKASYASGGNRTNCENMELSASEACEKRQARNLFSRYTKKKTAASRKERRIKQQEKKRKKEQQERRRKESAKKQKRRERDSKEKAKKAKKRERERKMEQEKNRKEREKKRREKDQKRREKNKKEQKVKERKTKVQEKKTKRTEKRSKEKAKKQERHTKAEAEAKSKGEEKHTKFKERHTKEISKKTKEKGQKEVKSKETKQKETRQKDKEKRGKAREKAQKEKAQKEVKDKQQKKEVQTKKREQATKEKRSKEKAKKTKIEQDQKENVKKTEQSRKEKVNKEKAKKAKVEGAQKEQVGKKEEKASKEKAIKTKEQRAKEKATKEKASKTKEQIDKEKKTKQQESLSKEKAKKEKAAKVQRKETAQKEKAAKATAKEQAAKTKANQVKEKADKTKQKANDSKAKAERAAKKAANTAANANARL